MSGHHGLKGRARHPDPVNFSRDQYKVAHITFEIVDHPTDGATFALIAGDAAKAIDRRPLFTGFVEDGMAAQLRAVADVVAAIELRRGGGSDPVVVSCANPADRDAARDRLVSVLCQDVDGGGGGLRSAASVRLESAAALDAVAPVRKPLPFVKPKPVPKPKPVSKPVSKPKAVAAPVVKAKPLPRARVKPLPVAKAKPLPVDKAVADLAVVLLPRARVHVATLAPAALWSIGDDRAIAAGMVDGFGVQVVAEGMGRDPADVEGRWMVLCPVRSNRSMVLAISTALNEVAE